MADANALRERVHDPGYTPAVRDVPSLVDLLAETDDATPILRALERVLDVATAAAITCFDDASDAHRARLCELVGRSARGGDPSQIAWVLARLHDPHGLVRRRAAAAIGKLENPAHEPALIDAWTRADTDPERKVIAAALGQSGSAAALALLGNVSTTDEQLDRVVRESVLKLERTRLRGVASSISLDTVPPAPVSMVLNVRPGLETLVCSAIAGATPAERGSVRVVWAESLRALYRVRTFVDLAFPLPPVRVASPNPSVIETAVVRILASEAASQILRTWTEGPIRWRLEWAGQGHRRGSTWRVVEALALARPELVNDPRDAPWEARVTLERDQVSVALRPRGLDDPRFTWRRGSVPASSHPTIAAALAAAAGVREGDVVWDPFVGAGAELVERGLLGPHAALLGTDHDPAAIDVARANLDAAGLGHAQLEVADASTYRPALRPTLLITNPPMGHRVRAEGTTTDARGDAHLQLGELFDRALSHWLSVIEPTARIVWLSPVPERTAGHHGVQVRLRQRVDLGGLAAELQVLEPAAASPFRRRAGQ